MKTVKMRAVVEIETNYADELSALRKKLNEDRDRLKDDLNDLERLMWKIFEECEIKDKFYSKKAAEKDSQD